MQHCVSWSGMDCLKILDELDDALLITDTRRKILKANRSACDLYGYTCQQLCAMCLDDLAEENGRQRRSNGFCFFAELSEKPLPSEPGHSCLTLVKICVRTFTGQIAAPSPEVYQELVESGPSLIARILPDTRVTFANEPFCQYFGLTHDKVIGRRFSDLPHDEATNRLLLDHFAAYLKRPENALADMLLVNGKGEQRWVQFTESPILDSRGDLQAIQLIAIDVHERKTAHILLQQSEAKYRAIMDQSNEGIILMDFISGKILEVNRKMTEICGFSNDELLSFTNHELSTETPEQARVAGLKLKHTAILPAETIRLNAKNGGTVEVDRLGKRLDIDGKAMALFSVRDVSEKRHIESQLRLQTTELQERVEQLQKAWSQTIDVLAAASEAKDPYTSGHQKRVARLAAALGHELGLPADQLTGLHMAALIHDIGKITVPADILSKPGILSNLERQMVQLHVTAGYDLLHNLDLPWNVADVVLQHHERLDGSGYPAGLKGDEILFKSRILCVADVVEAMSSHRPYRAALGIEEGLAEIRRGKGLLYDPQVVEACLTLFLNKDFVLA